MSNCVCDGKGYVWVGTADNAERVPCEWCPGEHLVPMTRLNWGALLGATLLTMAAFSTLYLFARLINA